MKKYFYHTLFALLFTCYISSLESAQNNNHVTQNSDSGIIDNILKSVEISAIIEEEWMIETHEGHTQKLETLIHPEIEGSLPFGLDFTAIGRLRYDVVDNIEHGTPSQAEISPASRRAIINNRIDFEFREFYIEKTINSIYFKLGRQQIVWGNADGLKVLDVVNPQDFREFIYDEWEDSRIPLWTVNVEIPIREWLMQLVWIPDRTYHKLPEANSSFAFTSPMIMPEPPLNVNLNLNSVKRPQRFFSDSDFGIRFSRFWKGWDFTLNYLYHYDDAPVVFREVSTSQIIPLVTVSPRYKRSHLVGGTFSNAFGNLVIRGEVGYFFNKFFVTGDIDKRGGVVEADELSYVMGFDWSGISNTMISLQLLQGIIISTPRTLIRDHVETNVSLYVSREFLNGILHLEFIWLQNLNRKDGFFRPKISYELKDNLILECGLDLFYGTGKGVFGQFDSNDRISLGIKFSM